MTQNEGINAPWTRRRTQLPPEILALILADLASNTRRNDLRPLCLISHLFYNLTVPMIYESLYLTTLSHEAPIDSTSLRLPHLPALLATFSSRPNLARHTRTFITHPSTSKPFFAGSWKNVKLIFPFLVKLKRLSISPPEAGPKSLMDSLPVGTKLTHFAIHLAFGNHNTTEFIRIQPLLQDLYLPQDVSIPGLTLTDAHTIQCSDTMFPVITLDRFPRLENLTVHYNAHSRHDLNSGVCHRLRTLKFASFADSQVFSVLENLEVVEFLHTVLFGRNEREDSHLRCLLKIPSKNLKYIHARAPLCDAEKIAVLVENLFEKHSSLVVLDCEVVSRPSPEMSVNRHIRLHGDERNSSQGGGGVGIKLVTGLKMIQVEVFHPWWEMPEIKDDVDEAFAARKCIIDSSVLNSDGAQASRDASKDQEGGGDV